MLKWGRRLGKKQVRCMMCISEARHDMNPGVLGGRRRRGRGGGVDRVVVLCVIEWCLVPGLMTDG